MWKTLTPLGRGLRRREVEPPEAPGYQGCAMACDGMVWSGRSAITLLGSWSHLDLSRMTNMWCLDLSNPLCQDLSNLSVLIYVSYVVRCVLCALAWCLLTCLLLLPLCCCCLGGLGPDPAAGERGGRRGKKGGRCRAGRGRGARGGEERGAQRVHHRGRCRCCRYYCHEGHGRCCCCCCCYCCLAGGVRRCVSCCYCCYCCCYLAGGVLSAHLLMACLTP